MEIFAIDKDWNVVATFKSFEEADSFEGEYFQILFREKSKAVHLYK